MKTLLITSLACVFLGIVGSCTKDETDPGRLQFKLRLLNSSNQETTTFTQGEPITLSFLVINTTDTDYGLAPFESAEFFKIYRLNAQSGSETAIGTPYQYIWCEYRLGIPIPAHDTLKLEIPWVSTNLNKMDFPFCGHSDNQDLPVGEYRTGFTSKFNYFNSYVDKTGNYETKRLPFNVNFSVK